MAYTYIFIYIYLIFNSNSIKYMCGKYRKNYKKLVACKNWQTFMILNQSLKKSSFNNKYNDVNKIITLSLILLKL